jgi:hypothetical protein
MIKQFSERPGLAGAPGLRAVAGIKGLVKEQAESEGGVNPAGTIAVKSGVVPEEREEVDDDEEKAG